MQVDFYSSTDLLEGLRAAGGLPAQADVPAGKGRAEWVGAHLRYRLTLKQQLDGSARWSLAVGDRHLGRSFHDGGILAIVPIGDAPEVAPLAWPADEHDVVPFLRALYGRLTPAAAFVADRRDLCALLVHPDDVRRGDLVADLRARYVERVLRAWCVARAAGDLDTAAAVHAILVAPPAAAVGDACSSLLDQARIWADQWSYQSGLHIEVPDTFAPAPVAAPAPPPAPADGPAPTAGPAHVAVAVEGPGAHPRLDELPSFWERVG